MSNDDSPKLELAKVIESLRAELTEAEDKGQGKDIRFTVEDVELELDIAVEKQKGVDLAAKFYVLTSKLKVSEKNMVTQKLKIKLKPHKERVDEVTGEKEAIPMDINGKVPMRE